MNARRPFKELVLGRGNWIVIVASFSTFLKLSADRNPILNIPPVIEQPPQLAF
jgi:hypothetical protein